MPARPAAGAGMTAETDGAALRLDRVCRRFSAGGREIAAVEEVSAVVAQGGITGLIGADGAGKTTLMRLIAGLLRPDRGAIEVLGIDVRRDPLAVQGRIGYMPQRFGLYEELTVRENLDLYADLHGVAPAARAARYAGLMAMTGLEPFTARRAGRLSGGMKQKLGLACTLVQPPRLLLLDEPTVGVDPVSRRELWEIIDRLTTDEGVTVLFSTAYLDEAARCRDVLLLHEGRLLAQGKPARFTAPMAGRTFRVAAPESGRRRLQARLAAAPGVIDTVIEGRFVRVVSEAAPWTPPPGIEAVAVAPRFEDGFVDELLRLRGGAATPSATSPAPPTPPPEPAKTVIAVERLTRRFGDFTAVDAVSFEVRRGEIFGLLGANGAGKSTTFRMLCGLLPASGGRLDVAGYDLRRARAAARGRIGYMAQKFSLYGDLTVAQNLAFFASAYGLRGGRRAARIGWALAEFGLGGMREAAARDLALGYRQRLALAAALMHAPDILFLDEPTSGVDPLARREFWRRIGALAEDGVTVLVTTHFMEEAEYCDRLVIMAQGRILAEGAPGEIRAGAADAARPDPTMEDAFVAVIGAASGAVAAETVA
ncbi:ATP-binding cassette domain-containing protein [Acidocella sp. C78]|uniref:ATP-binding cassette domain-containing protein n=1 Tax=Acidocella sp. C78 TaxID=1671486 RepID=UPI0035ADE2B0